MANARLSGIPSSARLRSIQLRHAYQGEPLTHRRATRWRIRDLVVANDGDSGVVSFARRVRFFFSSLFFFPSIARAHEFGISFLFFFLFEEMSRRRDIEVSRRNDTTRTFSPSVSVPELSLSLSL